MPRPLRVGKRLIWDRLKVEAAFTELDEDAGENSIDRALRVAAGLKRRGDRGAGDDRLQQD
jgi:hypothetical protein